MSVHACLTHPCPICMTAQPVVADIVMVPEATDRLSESIARLESEPTSCPCACHQPKHEARKPHPSTQIGRQ